MWGNPIESLPSVPSFSVCSVLSLFSLPGGYRVVFETQVLCYDSPRFNEQSFLNNSVSKIIQEGRREAMAITLRQALRVGSYIFKQKLKGNKRYPLVLMLEPLFRCNLACTGCGKLPRSGRVRRAGCGDRGR
jgi:hypothetical protein